MTVRDDDLSAVPVRLSRPGGPPLTSDTDAVPVLAGGFRTQCAAASIQLRFDPNGLVTLCCKSLQPLGHITTDRLSDLWNGPGRAKVEAALAAGDFSEGCQRCGAEITQEGRAVSYAAIHDRWAGHLTEDPASRAWPVRFEFNLSNSCNLQCVQCDGESSSSIRLHREGRPPLPKVYGDQFFEDLRPFLPHLERIVFAGGEPFLGAENFRVWDMLVADEIDLDCVVVTNATQWTPRIEALLEKLRFSFVFSLDGITRETYEAIRIGSNFDEVIANIERFRAYSRAAGTTASINHCLMPQNVHEFGDLLLWAEERDLHVDVSVVRTPAHAAIAELSADEIAAASALLEADEERVRPALRLNRATWDAERSRLAAWAAGAADPSGSTVRTVMWFRAAGSGPTDPEPAVAELRAWSADGTVHRVSVDHDDRIVACDAPFLGPDTDLLGSTLNDLTLAVTGRLGNMNHYEVVHTSDDRVDARALFGTTPARVTTVARRDEQGWADVAEVLIALGSPGPSN